MIGQSPQGSQLWAIRSRALEAQAGLETKRRQAEIIVGDVRIGVVIQAVRVAPGRVTCFEPLLAQYTELKEHPAPADDPSGADPQFDFTDRLTRVGVALRRLPQDEIAVKAIRPLLRGGDQHGTANQAVNIEAGAAQMIMALG